MTERAFWWLKGLLLGKLEQAEDLDGVLLALHGSMVVDGLDDPEGALLAEVRDLVGEGVCIGCSLDLHANVTEQMIAHADVLIGYETHRDYEEIGWRTAQKVIHCIRNGVKPHKYLKKIPAVFGAHSHVLEQKWRMEEEEGILSLSVFDCNPWTDVAEYGPSVVLVAEGAAEVGERLCAELAEAFWNVRDKAVAHLTPIPEAIERARHAHGCPTVLVEFGDLVGGGGAGDSVAVLDALLKSGIASVATVLYDPSAVSEAFEVGLGNEIETGIGGKHAYKGAAPLIFKGAVKKLYDGTFVLEGCPYGGVRAFLGKTAVLGAGGTDIVLTSKRIYPQGAAVFDALKMDVSGKEVIALKGYGADGDPSTFRFPVREVIDVDTPGWTVWDFRAVPYQKIERPIYPLDPI